MPHYQLIEGRATVEAVEGCTGNPKLWAFGMVKCGLGDHIQSLPVIYDLVARGVEPVIYGNPFMRPMYDRLCLRAYPEDEFGSGFALNNAARFGRIYSVREWGVDDDKAACGESALNRTSLFASFFGLDRPTHFDWVAALGAKVDNELRSKEYIIYSPQSENIHRTYPKEAETYYELKNEFQNIEWLGKPVGLRKIIPTLQELVQLVYNAKAVLACDNGVMHLAMSLGVPCMALFGASDESVVIEPYTFYLEEAHRKVLRTKGDGTCKRPCNIVPPEFGGTRGFGVDGKCLSKADCMIEFDPLSVTQSFKRFIGEINNASTHRIPRTSECYRSEGQGAQGSSERLTVLEC